MVDKGVVIWKEKEFEPSDIVDAYLVIAATNEPCVNEAVNKPYLSIRCLIMLEMHQMAMLSFQAHYTATS